MADISLAFSAENGISLDDVVGIFSGSIDPSVTGETAPIGSIFIRDNGQLFQKTGTLDLDWIKFSQGLGEATKISSGDTVAGYLNVKLLTSSNITKTVNSASGYESLSLDLSDVGTAGTYKSVTVDSKGRVVAGTNPTTLGGYGISDAQPLSNTLTGLAGVGATAGILVQISPNAFVTRSIAGSANQITVTNPAGTSGNPTLSFPSTSLTFPGTAGIIPPRGTTVQRVATQGYTRFNTTTSRLEYYTGTAWISCEASTGGTVTSIDLTAPAAGITVGGGPISTAGTITLSLVNDLAAVEGLSTTGLAVRTGADTWTTRSLSGIADRTTVINGDFISGNATVDIASTYTGQSSISTLGTITAGIWNGSTLSTAFGGTGRTTIGGANTLLGVNTAGSVLEYKTINAGVGINVNPTAGLITISNTGVTNITGTANQVNASANTGAVVLSLPQSIAPASSPTFTQITVGADPTLALQVATKQYVDNAVVGLSFKNAARAASTANVALSGLQTIDGISLVAGDRVLIKNQTATSENGIYTVSNSGWTRASDMDSWTEVPSAFTFVQAGTQNADTSWICTSDNGGTLDTTAISFVQFGANNTITAGTGLTKTGNTLSITNTGVSAGTFNTVTVNAQGQVTSASNAAYLTGNQSITLSGDITGVGANAITTALSLTGVTAGTYRSVTVDAKGRISAGSNPTTIAGYGLTDAQPLNSFLTSEAALATNGFVVRNGNTAVTRSLSTGSSKLSLTNADGTAGNPVLDVVESNLLLNNIGGVLDAGHGGTGISAIAGFPNYIVGVNALGTAYELKAVSGGAGISITPTGNNLTISATNLGTVTSVAVTGSTGLSVSGSPVTSNGTINLTLGTELQGLSGLSANGVIVRTNAGVYASRNIASGNGTISITNPAGTAGNIGLDLATIGSAGTYKSVTTDIYGRVTSGTNPTTLSGYGITDAVNTAQLGAVSGVATLDASGKIPASQLPALAITDTFVVASQAAMLALSAEVGDVAVRTDINKSFILKTAGAGILGNWQELLSSSAAGTVTSIAMTAPIAGITVTGSPITTSGTLTLSLANDLAAVEGLATTGLAVRTGTDAWTTRSILAGSGISITNGSGTAGDITISSLNAGTVTSVGLSLPSIFSVSNSPITSVGTLTASLTTQVKNTVLAGPIAGANAAPTFRTLSLTNNDISDVVLTSPSLGQVVSYDGTKWVNTGAVGSNATGIVGTGQVGANAWVLVSGSRYRADFAHNLATFNVTVTVYDVSTNAVVIPDSIVLTSTNNIRVTAIGNTRTLRVVVVANGQSIVAGGSTPSSVIVANNGATVATATKINFTGNNILPTDAGSGTVNVNIGSRFTYFANSLDTPNNADFIINAIAPVTPDPQFNSINVRSFSNTVEQGVGFLCSIPVGATQMTLKMRGKPSTVPGVASVVQPRLYSRIIPNGAAVGAWSAAYELPNIAVPTNNSYQYYQQTISLSTLSLTADRVCQFELTRRIAGVTGTNLAAAFLLAELTVEFA